MAETLTNNNKARMILPHRKSYKGPPIQIHSSFGKNPKLTQDARDNIVLDYLDLVAELANKRADAAESELKELRAKRARYSTSSNPSQTTSGQEQLSGQQKGAYRLIGDHYGVSKQTVHQLVQKANEEGKFTAAQRPGAPLQMGPEARKVVLAKMNAKQDA